MRPTWTLMLFRRANSNNFIELPHTRRVPNFLKTQIVPLLPFSTLSLLLASDLILPDRTSHARVQKDVVGNLVVGWSGSCRIQLSR